MAGRNETPEATREVVWISHRDDDKCSKCGKEIWRGAFIQVNRTDGVRCLDCAGYGDMEFLTAGDARLTREATALTSLRVIVVKWSSARKRHERQGILIDAPVMQKLMAALPPNDKRRRLAESMNQ